MTPEQGSVYESALTPKVHRTVRTVWLAEISPPDTMHYGPKRYLAWYWVFTLDDVFPQPVMGLYDNERAPLLFFGRKQVTLRREDTYACLREAYERAISSPYISR